MERLDERDLAADPISQFRAWFADATARGVYQPHAMVLGTIGEDGAPQSRTVLLQGVDERGFVFYTDRSSRKGRALAARPTATLLFPWYTLHRQVNVTGEVTFVADAESDAYWQARPHGSRVSATASAQSQPVAGRDELERRVGEVEVRYPEGVDVPRPERWGGYRLTPRRVEFWQGRTSRLHDRLVFERDAVGGVGGVGAGAGAGAGGFGEAGEWRVVRLQP